MGNTLLVPIHLECLYLPHIDVVAEAMTAFENMPYSTKSQDFQPDTANVSEDILSQPFENKTLPLMPGIHLHWSLPDILTKGHQKCAVVKVIVKSGAINSVTILDGGTGYTAPPIITATGNCIEPAVLKANLGEKGAVTKITILNPGAGYVAAPDIIVASSQDMEFPAVPDRWLITRTYSGKDKRSFPAIKKWVVESNYQFHDDAATNQSIKFPFVAKPGEKPYRHLGRKVAFEDWSEPKQTENYLAHLSAVGYGESAFAAFYPNCLSVFGFHDSSIVNMSQAELGEFTYDIIGWYGREEQDPVVKLMSNLTGSDDSTKTKSIESILHWHVGTADKSLKNSVPDRIACYAHTRLKPDSNAIHSAASSNNGKTADATIAVGNTGTEALSALLAKQRSPNNKNILEDQLEALHLSGRLDGMELDVGAKFKEARHEKSFQAVSGGIRWSIRTNTPAGQSADTASSSIASQVMLNQTLGQHLNELNRLQYLHNRGCDELKSIQIQGFADWYKYMLCEYPPQDFLDSHIDSGEVRHFLNSEFLPLVEKQTKALGELYLETAEDGSVTDAQDSNGNNDTLAFQVAQQLNTVLDLIKTDNENSPLLGVLDIVDWTELLAAFRNKPRSKALDRIWLKSDQNFKGLIEQASLTADLSDDWKTKTVKSFNRLISDSSLFTDEDFQKIKLPVVASRIASNSKQTSSLGDARILNRILLELALPKIVKRGSRNQWALKSVPAPRYWESRSPVVLMTGSALEATKRHGFDRAIRPDGLLPCVLVDDTISDSVDKDTLAQLHTKLLQIAGKSNSPKPGITIWTGASWHPFLLEWEVEVFPLREGSNHTQNENKYQPDFITSNFSMDENAPDLNVRPERHKVMPAANVYRGRTVLTPNAETQLKWEIEAYLKLQMISDYADDLSKTTPSKRSSDESVMQMILKNYDKKWQKPKDGDIIKAFNARISDLIPWYGERDWKSSKPTVTNIIATYNDIMSADFHSLSQALGGFDHALLMQRQVLQLPVSDPLAFDDNQGFTDDIGKHVGKNNICAPQPQNSFNPIRTGHMKVLKLRLIDTFGRTKDVVQEIAHNPIAPSSMEVPWDPDVVYLPPRIVQPARLNFRWLSARHDEQEMNDHPTTTPVCGWLLPNNLDGSLMVFDASGGALGYIDQETRWRPTPGGSGSIFAPAQPVSVNAVGNPHLRKVVNQIRSHGEVYFDEFINTVDAALENIDPEGFAQHQALALLMGRPIAVVRASLDLEIKGLSAENQSWGAFRERLGGRPDQTAGSREVKFPVRIGEYRQLNDGVVGYWNERGDAGDQIFHVNDSNKNATLESNKISRTGDADTNIEISIDSAAHTLTMLVDPRGKAHASMGILPTKAIDIPSDQYADALASISLTFFTAPILSDIGSLKIPLPAERGYEWSWVEKRKDSWVEIPRSQIGTPSSEATLSSPQAIREGWLKLTPTIHNAED